MWVWEGHATPGLGVNENSQFSTVSGQTGGSRPVNYCGLGEFCCKRNMRRKKARASRPINVSHMKSCSAWQSAKSCLCAEGNPQMGEEQC